MKETLGEFAYVDGEVFVGSTKAGTMVFDPEQPAWVFTLAVDGAEPVSYDDDLEWALDELRDDRIVKMRSHTDQSWKREFSTTWDGAQIAVDLIEELGGIEPEDGKLIPNHGDFAFPNPDEDEEAYDEAYRAASEELMTYYDSLSLTEVADEIANIAGKSAQLYYWVEEK